MFLARIAFFRLYESPRYLVHAGRPHEAVKSLQLISRFNGSELPIELADVRDHHGPSGFRDARQPGSRMPTRVSSATTFDASVIEDRPPIFLNTENSTSSDRSELVTVYDSTGKSDGVSALTTEPETTMKDDSLHTTLEQPLLSNQRRASGRRRNPLPTPSGRSFMYGGRLRRILPRWLRFALMNWWSRIVVVLSPEWVRTTVLVWLSWGTMSLGMSIPCILPVLMISSVYNVQRLPSKITRNARGQDRITDTGDESVGSCVFHARGMSRFSCLFFELSSLIMVTQLLRRIGRRIYH